MGVLEGPESLYEGGLRTGDWHAANAQVLPELRNLKETKKNIRMGLDFFQRPDWATEFHFHQRLLSGHLDWLAGAQV